MLMIQSGFKSDLETNRMIFMLFMSNEDKVYNCSIEYNIIKDAKDGKQLADALIPMIQSLSNALMQPVVVEDVAKKESECESSDPVEKPSENAA